MSPHGRAGNTENSLRIGKCRSPTNVMVPFRGFLQISLRLTKHNHRKIHGIVMEYLASQTACFTLGKKDHPHLLPTGLLSLSGRPGQNS